MGIFSTQDFELFKQVCAANQKGLMKILSKYLNKTYGKENVVITKQYICAEGKTPIALTAHLDTVHREVVSEIYFDEKQDVMWSPQGLGADDRAGVFAILKLIQMGERPHVIFTTDEEIGCIGAHALSRVSRETFFKQLHFIIEIDRRGSKDSVFYDCGNKKFEKYINSFGFETNWGTFSDISEICPKWEVAGVNLSSGYYNEHSYAEYLKTAELNATIEKVRNILHSKSKEYKFIPTYGLYDYFKYGYDYAYGGTYKRTISNYFDVVCKSCGNEFLEEETFPTKTLTGSTAYYCPDCVCNYVDWCDNCLEAFEKFETKDKLHLCLDCREAYAEKITKKEVVVL